MTDETFPEGQDEPTALDTGESFLAADDEEAGAPDSGDDSGLGAGPGGLGVPPAAD